MGIFHLLSPETRERALAFLAELDAWEQQRKTLREKMDDEVAHYSRTFGADTEYVRTLVRVQRMECEVMAYVEAEGM